jgi:hypothetical protein
LLFECNLANRIACSLATYDEKTQAASNNNDNNNSNSSKSTSRLSLCKQRANAAKGLLFECNLANRIACSLATYDEKRQAEDKKKKVEQGEKKKKKAEAKTDQKAKEKLPEKEKAEFEQYNQQVKEANKNC